MVKKKTPKMPKMAGMMPAFLKKKKKPVKKGK
jgi:hypothetical protein